jgi:hypothetical protein
MKYRMGGLALAAALLLAACQPTPPPAAQSAAQSDDPYAKLAALPDWSGIWEIDWRNERGITTPRPQMKLTPEYQKRLDAFRAAQKDGENLQGEAANCVPSGMPGIMTQPYPIEFLFQPDKVVMLIETYMQYRHIWTDGRALPEDPDEWFNGHSVGRWEGETLVVDTIGINAGTLLAPGVPHSDQLKITERIRRVAPEWLEIEVTLTDPVVLAEPFVITNTYHHLDDELREYVCLENNRDGADEKGRPSLRLE